MIPGGLGDLSKLMKEAQKLQQKIMDKKADLARLDIAGSSGGGMVTVVVTGDQQVKSIQIEKEVIDPSDPEMLQDLLVAALNDALSRSREKVQEQMAGLTGGLGIPGLL